MDKASTEIGIQAKELALALEWGEADVDEVAAWADALMTKLREPEYFLIEVSMATNISTALTHLNSLADSADTNTVIPRFLRRLSKHDSMSPSKASSLARKLFFLAMKHEKLDFLHPFYTHWDDIDLAIEGIYGDPEKRVSDFLHDIKKAANASVHNSGTT